MLCFRGSRLPPFLEPFALLLGAPDDRRHTQAPTLPDRQGGSTMQHGSQHPEGTGPTHGSDGAQPAPYNRKATMRQELDMMLNGRYHVNRQLNSA